MKGCVIAGSATGESSEKASDGMSYDTGIKKQSRRGCRGGDGVVYFIS